VDKIKSHLEYEKEENQIVYYLSNIQKYKVKRYNILFVFSSFL
jgi:hypothetical protein